METNDKGIIKAEALLQGNSNNGNFGIDWILIKLADGREVLYYQEVYSQSVELTVVSSNSPISKEEAIRIAEDVGYFFSEKNKSGELPQEGEFAHRW